MNFAIFMLTMFLLTLFAILIRAIITRVIHRDAASVYPLYKVRDEAIAAHVFSGVKRDDPWLDYIYSSTNTLLQLSKYISGPGTGWNTAKMVGETLANPGLEQYANDAPTPPTDGLLTGEIRPIVEEFDRALAHLATHHIGIQIMLSTKQRSLARQRRDQAIRIQKTLRDNLSSPSLA